MGIQYGANIQHSVYARGSYGAILDAVDYSPMELVIYNFFESL